jgi:protease-4
MEKVGVKSYTFKSGRYKDILNPTREPTAAETNLVQTLIMEVYDKFVETVAREREMNVDELKSGLADGRILSGKQAKDAHFIDETGYFEDAIDMAKQLGHVKKARVVRYSRPFSLRDLLRFFGQSDQQAKVRIELGTRPLKLETGKLYYLPAFLFQ